MSGRVLLAAACVVLLLPGVAAAAPKHCPQLTDPAGDQTPPSDPAADLLSLTLGSDRTSLTLVLRYAGEQPSDTPVTGHEYVADLNTGEGGLTAQALVAPSGATFSLYRHAASAGQSGTSASGGIGLGRLAGAVDEKAHAVTMVVPFAMAPDILRRRQLLVTSARVATSVMSPDLPMAGRAFTGEGSDDSDAPVDYRVGPGDCRLPRG